MSTARRLAAVAGIFAGALVASSIAVAAFNSASSASHSIQTKRIFSGARTTGMRDFADASSGTAVAGYDPLSYAEGTYYTTGSWTTAFGAARYFQVNLNSPLPAGVAVSGVNFNFRMSATVGGNQACYYFEVRRQSDNSLLGTHFSSGSPQCVTGTTLTTVTTPLTEVTTSDIANDMYVKVFGRSSGSRPMRIDLATVTLTLLSTSVTQFQKAYTDASTGTAATTTWQFDATDSAQFTSAANWTTAFGATRYLQFWFPAIVPTGSVVSAASFRHSYRSATAGDQTCYYFEAYSSTTLLATHGSAASPFCSSLTTFKTDDTSLPEVNTVAEANSVVIKLFVRNSGARKSVDDVDTLTLTYSLD
jgi:hypothetical protein